MAITLLIRIALSEDRPEDAEELLKQLPANGRAAAELSLGGAIWNRYQQQLRSQGNNNSPENEKLKQRATELLGNGYQSLQDSATPSAAAATGLLYYVQVLLDDKNYDQAIEVLEHPNIGPLTFARDTSAGKPRPEFVRETFKAALRAYISIAPPRTEDAQSLMDELDRLAQGQADAEKQLTSIYINLGLQLQRQLTELKTAGQHEQTTAVADTFAHLLERVSQRSDVSDWKMRNWIAQTNLQLGEGVSGPEASRYLEQAEDAFRGILAAVEKDPSYAPNPLAVLGVRKRLGDCQLANRQYKAAYQQYKKILTEKPSILELQQAAALALQRWGTEEQLAEKLEQSIRGAESQANQKNLVWGWLQLAKVAQHLQRKAAQKQDDPNRQKNVTKYEDMFFNARFHAVEARYAAAQIADETGRASQLRKAIQSLNTLQQLYPELGGPNWKPRFEELLQEMKNAQ